VSLGVTQGTRSQVCKVQLCLPFWFAFGGALSISFGTWCSFHLLSDLLVLTQPGLLETGFCQGQSE
jgi:hypothetical protein